MDSKIIIYGAEWCAFCHQAMNYLDGIGIKYTYKNVDMNPDDAKESVQKSGQTGIPVLDIDGTIIVGFNRQQLDQALKEKKVITKTA